MEVIRTSVAKAKTNTKLSTSYTQNYDCLWIDLAFHTGQNGATKKIVSRVLTNVSNEKKKAHIEKIWM